jgi:hypothetical protein
VSRSFTNSELAVARRCWRKWYFNHYLKIFRQRVIIKEDTYTGNLIHASVADLYNRGNDPLAVIAFNVATDIASEQQVLIDATDQTRAIIEENIEKIKRSEEMATLVVQGYIQWLEEDGADAHLTFISAEEELSVRFPAQNVQDLSTEGEVRLLGKLDARFLDQRTAARVFMDHKSVQNFSDREKWVHLDTQFLFYGLIEYLDILERSADDQASTDWTDGGIVNMLRRSKRTARATPPFYKRLEVRHSIHELRNFFSRTAGEITRILQATAALESGVDHHLVCAPNPTRDCAWDCPYMQLCSIVDDGSDATGFIEEVFTVGDPLKRYSTVDGS